ncbi:hypothetical protein [Pararobbsia silviterrae]|uniref:Uncharacterized protein n=1 Tax=Pararobbsia silviterrae TaxID=1792498 RepID=A0A494Y0T1_9BURK|nr:hypothetical protein [Pararobbsia silviterrae]RKP56387.1 hypothetical protein D7S86_08300 [Pararobbsia silviterrae]
MILAKFDGAAIVNPVFGVDDFGDEYLIVTRDIADFESEIAVRTFLVESSVYFELWDLAA